MLVFDPRAYAWMKRFPKLSTLDFSQKPAKSKFLTSKVDLNGHAQLERSH